MEIELANSQARLRTTGSGNVWGRAILDLTDPNALGFGLRPGEFLEFDLRRAQSGGNIGWWRPGGGNSRVDPSGLQIWADRFGTDQGSTWNTLSPAGVSFDPDQWLTLGIRLDYADGAHQVVSYYVDGDYAGSWLYPTSATSLDQVALFAQDSASGRSFLFDNVRVWASPEPGTMVLLGAGLAALARRKRRRE
jgi:hypothetical protein